MRLILQMHAVFFLQLDIININCLKVRRQMMPFLPKKRLIKCYLMCSVTDLQV